MDDRQTNDTLPKTATQRRRTAYACVSCRARKTRCDGQEVCGTCVNLGIECHYDHDVSSSKGKSDLILSAILRLEQSISNIDLNVSALRQDVVSQTLPQVSPNATRSDTSHGNRTRSFSRYTPPLEDFSEFANATISNHTSTTEAILHWPVFDAFPELRRDDVVKSGSIFWIENVRHRSMYGDTNSPSLSEAQIDRLIQAFSATVNFSYPIVSQQVLRAVRSNYSSKLDLSTRACLSLLVLALGCAAQIVSCEDRTGHEILRLRHLGKTLFDAAVTRLHAAYSIINTEAIQCLALTALYYAYLQRPIQAWSMLSSTATACRVLFAYNMLGSDDAECVRRVFWTCFILESDYLAELPALPHFGIADIESSVPLPGQFTSQNNPGEDDLSSVYFTACISMRRLLNRCHHLLFGSNNDKPSTRKREEIVAELDQQLEDWRRLLPPAIQFTVGTEPVSSQHGAFLRQRYLTCLALIHRPYVMKALTDHFAGRTLQERTIAGAQRCLQACAMHILNLRPFDQTIIVDMWICSLSMAGTMMILLAASNVKQLSDCVGHSIYAVGPHLLALFRDWANVHGEGQSPSVQQAIDWIKIVDSIIQQPPEPGK